MSSTSNYIPKVNIPETWNDRLKRTINEVKNTGYSSSGKKETKTKKVSKKKHKHHIYQKKNSTGTDDSSSESSSGSGITSGNEASEDTLDNDTSGSSDTSSDGSSSSGSTTGTVSPLLEGSMSFEDLIREICDGIDLIFAVKRSTVVITDYESIYAEAKYLRDNYHSSVQAEDLGLWQLEDGTYELEVSEYGFYNTVKVHYKNGTITESYEDLVRVYGEVVIEYDEKKLDKTSAIYKAKAYLAAHVRDFEMSVKVNLLHDADIDIGDIVTLENPMTMRDSYRKSLEKRDPEYLFVTANSISWDGDGPILNSLDLRYGAKSPKKKEVPESGAGSYADQTFSSDVDSAIDEVGKLAAKISYSGACQTHDCVQSKKTGDCWGMSDYIACELKTRGVETQIYQYPTSAANNHRSVKYKDTTGNWVRFPYRKYGVSYLFRDTDGVDSGSKVDSTC